MEIPNTLASIYLAWADGDKDGFRSLIIAATNGGIGKSEIIKFLEENRINKPSIDEDFEEWAYLFITTEGMNDCPPG
ncbi:MAG: hypothetical protein ACYC21_08435 [Eubacteriales bacterium]